MVFDSSLSNLKQKRNQSYETIPNDKLVHIGQRITKKKVEELAVQRSGQGIIFSDVIKKFGCSKPKAQCKLKVYRIQGALFTLKRTSPHYNLLPICS